MLLLRRTRESYRQLREALRRELDPPTGRDDA